MVLPAGHICTGTGITQLPISVSVISLEDALREKTASTQLMTARKHALKVCANGREIKITLTYSSCVKAFPSKFINDWLFSHQKYNWFYLDCIAFSEGAGLAK
jgi:hypothetical protein